MRVHYILHASFEKLGVIEEWLKKQSAQVTGTHSWANEPLPAVSEFDMLIVMGGPQSAVNVENYPYLQAEVQLIQAAIRANKVVLGICLGAQLIGIALGAKAEPSPSKEIGVYPVQLTPAAQQDPLFKQFPPQFDTMHWHSDMAGLSAECVLLAHSEGCPRQAFRYGDRVYAIQYHMELTPKLIAQMATHCEADFEPDTYVQVRDELLKEDLSAINNMMYVTLEYLTNLVKTNNLALQREQL